MASKRRSVGVRQPPPEFYDPPILPTPDPPATTPHPRGTRRTARGTEKRELLLPGIDDGPRAIAYGEQRLAGKMQFAHYLTGSDELWVVIELCAGECDALLEVLYSDGRAAPTTVGGSAKWQYWWYPGTAAGQIDPNLAAVLPSWNEPLAGTCYVVLRLKSFGKYWKATVPDFLWRMRTRKCLMPDTGLYTYSDDLWNQWYDFVRWQEGKSLPTTRVDAASFVTARAADVSAARKAKSNLLLLEDQDPDDVIDTFRLMARAYWFWDANKFRVVADRPATPTITFTDEHVSASSQLDLDRINDVFDRANKVTIWYTDRVNGWVQKPLSLETAAVTAGTEEPIEEEFRLPHLHDPAQVKTLLTYLLNSKSYDGRLRERWRESTSATTLGNVVSRFIESRSITMPVRVVKRRKNPDNTYDVELHQHDDAKFSEFVLTDAAKIESSLPDPGALPPAVDSAAFTSSWLEELYSTQDRTWLPRASFTVTVPSFAYLDDKIPVYVSINGGPTRFWFNATVGTNITPVLYETGSYSITLYTKNVITQEQTSVTVARTVNGVTVTPQSPGEFFGDNTNGWYWDAPPLTRIEVAIAAASITGSNMTVLTPAALVDDVETVTAAQFGALGTLRSMTIDFGASPQSIAEIEWVLTNKLQSSLGTTSPMKGGFGAGENLFFYYADAAGGPWTEITPQQLPHPVDRELKKFIWRIPAAVRGHRYIRWENSGFISSGYTPGIAEIRAYTFSGTYDRVAGYLLTKFIGRDPGDALQFAEAEVVPPPTAGNRILPKNVEVTVRDRDDLYGGYSSGAIIRAMFVQTLLGSGVLSEGRMLYYETAFASLPANATGTAQEWVPQTQNTINLVNGLNSNIATTLGPGAQDLDGPTGAFTLGGFVAPLAPATAAWLPVSYRGSQACTIANAHASSSAANRIKTFAGADVIARGAFEALFRYDPVDLLWHLIAFNDGFVSYENSALVLRSIAGTPAIGLQVRAANATSDAYMGVGFDMNSDALILGYGGGSFGRGAGFMNVRPDASALAPNPSLRIFIANVEAARFDNTRNFNLVDSFSVASGAKVTRMLVGSTTWNPPSRGPHGNTQTTITVTGAAVGDFVVAVELSTLTTENALLRGYVSAANTVTVILSNLEDVISLDPGSGTLTALVMRAS